MANYQQEVRDILTDPKSFATTLLVVAWDRYGTDLTTWSPATLRMELEQDFTMKMPKPNFDRLMAAISLVMGNEFYKHLPTFIRFCNILSGDDFDPRVFDIADSDEIAWGITEAMLICRDDEEEPFESDIRWYIGALLDAEGVVNPPDVLRIALRDQVKQMIPSEYADDPEMFQGLWAAQNERSQEIKEIIRGNLNELLRQVVTAPLVHGDTEDLVRKIQKELHS